MEQITKAEQERLLKVRAVDIGFEFTNGQPTGRLAIRYM